MSENNEEKVVKKTTTRKTTPKTTTRSNTKTTTKKEVVEDKKEITLNDIPKELLDQLTKQILSTINVNQPKEEVKEVKQTKNTKPARYTKAFLNSDENTRKELIQVRSIYNGGVNFVSPKTGIKYKWLEKDSTEYLSVSELLSMESSSLRFLHTPWLVVDDERVIEAFGLENLYSMISEVNNLEQFLDNDIEHIEEIVNKLPNEFKIELISDIYKGLQDKTLRIDYIVLQKLQELLHYDFME